VRAWNDARGGGTSVTIEVLRAGDYDVIAAGG
jgi:hypothetical protein